MDLVNMTQDAASGLLPPVSADISNLVKKIRERIHTNIEAIINLLNKKPAGEVWLLTDLFASANQLSLLEKALLRTLIRKQLETQILIYLARSIKLYTSYLPGSIRINRTLL
jgi:hypothetical protein